MRSCFVILPRKENASSNEEYETIIEVYEDYVKPIVEENGLDCISINELIKPGHIVTEIAEKLEKSFLVIVEMTGQDPNVFYELGVRHALSNRTILICQNESDIPVDLFNYRTLTYRFTPSGAKKLGTKLQKIIEDILEAPDINDSPILKDLSGISKKEIAEEDEIKKELLDLKNQNVKLILDIENLKEAINSIALIPQNNIDLNGTWYDSNFKLIKYIKHNWSRFDESLGGKGYFYINHIRNEMKGGLWFDNREVKEMINRKMLIEAHELKRNSIKIEGEGQRLVKQAQDFINRKLLRPWKEYKKEIQDLLRKANTQRAISSMEDFLIDKADMSDVSNQLIVIGAAFNKIQKDKNLNIITREAEEISTNKINTSIISLINQVDENSALNKG